MSGPSEMTTSGLGWQCDWRCDLASFVPGFPGFGPTEAQPPILVSGLIRRSGTSRVPLVLGKIPSGSGHGHGEHGAGDQFGDTETVRQAHVKSHRCPEEAFRPRANDVRNRSDKVELEQRSRASRWQRQGRGEPRQWIRSEAKTVGRSDPPVMSGRLQPLSSTVELADPDCINRHLTTVRGAAEADGAANGPAAPIVAAKGIPANATTSWRSLIVPPGRRRHNQSPAGQTKDLRIIHR